MLLDEAGNRIGSTCTIFTVTNGGGRAASALMTVAEMDYLFHVQNVVVFHHSFCGTSSYLPESVFKKFHDHYHAEISTLFDHDSLAIPDFEKSLKYDLELLRSSPAVPQQVKLYGFSYEINSGKLIEVLRDIPAEVAV
jgi:carbonic anhydrase